MPRDGQHFQHRAVTQLFLGGIAQVDTSKASFTLVRHKGHTVLCRASAAKRSFVVCHPHESLKSKRMDGLTTRLTWRLFLADNRCS